MNRTTPLLWTSLTLALVGVAACSAEQPAEADAPEITDGALATQDEGETYNGWTQVPQLWLCNNGTSIRQWMRRDAGSQTSRGGGACYVRPTGAACSSDSTCLSAAIATHGGLAYGYCFQGQCYTRPGSQATYCANNPNATVSQYGSFWAADLQKVIPQPPFDNLDRALGCMTKTPGPNTACGGTDGSQYMRHVSSLVQTCWVLPPF